MTPEEAVMVLREFMEHTRRTFGRTFPRPSEAVEVLAAFVLEEKMEKTYGEDPHNL
jgi:hypothetical protein